MQFCNFRIIDFIDTKKILMVIGLVFLSIFTVQASQTRELTLPRIQVVPIKDTQADRQYELYIKLPQSYTKDTDKNYPVIYFTDAQTHVELLSGTEFLMEEVILVGISDQIDFDESRGLRSSRARDYSVSKSSNAERQAKYQFGQANKHLAFIRNDVIKFIESNYRADTSNRTYFGFSLGGLFGTYALMSHPDTFKNYILGSPSLWRDIPLLFSLENPALNNKGQAINVFITYGELEKELSVHVEDFIAQLKNKKYKALSSIKQVVIDSSGHSDSFPMVGVRSMKWLADLQNSANSINSTQEGK